MLGRTNEMLRDLNGTEGIHECLIVGRDGFVIDHVGDMSAEEVGAKISTSIGTVESMGRDIRQGGLFEIMAEFNDGTVIAAPVGQEAVLGVIAGKGANLGGVRYAVKKTISLLEKAL